MVKLRKKLYYLLFCFKNYGLVNGVKLWLSIEIIENEVVVIPNIKKSIFLRKGTSDKYAFRQIFLLNEYNFLVLKDIKNIIDAGSNIGLFSVFAKNIFPDSKIICIEPEATNFQTLLKNISGYDNIYSENKGLWYRNSKLNIIKIKELGEWGTQVVEDVNGSIDAISIDYIIDKYKLKSIDILKIDIETSEKYLFNNNSDWLKISKYIIIEFHDRIQPQTSMGFFKALIESNINFNYYIMGDNTVIENLDYNND